MPAKKKAAAKPIAAKAAEKSATKSKAASKKRIVQNESDEDDFEVVDMFQSIKPATVPAVPAKTSDLTIPVEMDNEKEDSSDEERFIANENIAANRKHKKSGGFQSMGLSHPVFKAVLQKGYKVPTPIQRKCIPLIMQGQDVVGMARTGSGKTAAFLIPLLERLKSHSAKVGARALVLSPSRELAMQTQKVCKELGKHTDLRSCVLVGGDNMDDQFSMIASNPDILIATPGRLLHLAVEMDLDLRSIEYVVFDEADRLFEMGFAVQLHEILSRLPANRQTLLFSATLPKMLVDFAKAGLQEPTLIRLDADTKISKDLEMAFFCLKDSEKEAALLYLLRNVIKLPKKTSVSAATDESDNKDKKKKQRSATEEDKQTILFVATKHHVEYLSQILSDVGYQVSYVYGSLDQTARNIQINRFRNGYTNLLVVTDVAARGIDIPILENVINYDFAGSSKVFVHRVGRAARAGRHGWAYSLVTPSELPYVVDLALFLTRQLVVGNKEKEKSNVDYTSGIILGAFPKDVLGDDIDWFRQKVASDAALEGQVKTATNAYKLYNRTKPKASSESYVRAKEIMKKSSWGAVHPLLASSNQDDEVEQQRQALLSKISGFRPQETVFEVGRRGTKKADAATMIMRTRRETMDSVINAARSKAKEAVDNEFDADSTGARVEKLGGEADEEDLEKVFNIPSATAQKKSHRDEEYYIHYTQKDANTERGYSMATSGSFMEQAGQAQLDLVGDDKDALSSQSRKNALRWDPKKKKFVRGTGIGSDNKKMIRTESGALISATYKSGRFDEWAKKQRVSIPRTGEQELANAAQIKQNVKRYGHNNDSQKRKREEPTSELKSAAQIRKQRLIKQKRKEKNARPSKKQKKH